MQPAGLQRKTDSDWGADSLTYALWLRWQAAGDASIPPLMAELTASSSPTYPGAVRPARLRVVERQPDLGLDRRRPRGTG